MLNEPCLSSEYSQSLRACSLIRIRLVGNSLELGFIELLSECFTLCDQTGVGSDQLVELIKLQHKSPALIRYADRITKNKFDSTGGFNLGGGINDARYVSFILT